MARNGRHDERRLLRASMVVTAAMGAAGVAVGIAVGSQMILLDGVYSFVGITMSWLLLWASTLSDRGPTRRFNFGMEAATPLAIAVQAFVLLATLLYAAVEAVYAIRDGGSEVTAGWGIAYGALTTAGCVTVTVRLRRNAGHSDLLGSEASAWRVASWRGVGMVVGFGILLGLEGSRWSSAAPYVDPAMVIVSCVALLPGPLGLLRTTVGELLEEAPDDAIGEQVRAAVASVQDRFELDEPSIHVTKLGPKLYVEVGTTASPNVTIEQEHEVRESLRSILDDLPYDVWLNVELVPRSADHSPRD